MSVDDQLERARKAYEASHAEFVAVAEELEAEFKDRELKFTVVFEGMVPVQAFGWLDGSRFYFRFRSDYASLIVGKYDKDWEQEDFDKRLARYREAKEARVAAGRISMDDWDMFDHLSDIQASGDHLPTGLEPDYYPVRREFMAGFGNVTGEPYAGALSPNFAKEVFRKLVNSLVEDLRRS